MYLNTEGILGEDGGFGGQWLRVALIVDGCHPELVRLSGLQSGDIVGGWLSLTVDLADTHPLASGGVHLLDFVLFDGQSTVVVRFGPAQFASFLVNIRHFQRSFRCAWFT